MEQPDRFLCLKDLIRMGCQGEQGLALDLIGELVLAIHQVIGIFEQG